MKELELRIGHFLYFPFSDEIVEVLGLNAYENKDEPKGVGHLISFRKDNSLYFEPIQLLSPIELTKDWLIKFGYTKEDSNFWFIGHIVWEYDDGVFICDKNGITLKYVHQLQNLYFALTGKELTLQNTAE